MLAVGDGARLSAVPVRMPVGPGWVEHLKDQSCCPLSVGCCHGDGQESMKMTLDLSFLGPCEQETDARRRNPG